MDMLYWHKYWWYNRKLWAIELLGLYLEVNSVTCSLPATAHYFS